ncbi:MAG TPA: hypothetical protein VNH38_05120 [Candidatus Dormibacteraeota bacterium]|nr:hypothetical protein [Candidatus Dormibacteraeota bacterium]
MSSMPSTAAAGAGSQAAQIAAGVTSSATIARVKRTMLWGIALLWLLDAALQAQPRMFTVDFVSNIMKPSIAIAPSFIGTIANWSLSFVTPHIALFNWLFMLTQFVIAFALIGGLIRRNHNLTRAGLLLSIAWGMVVWVAGEGTSGVFTGNGTMLTGAPGSVFLYMAVAVFFLLPDKWWQFGDSLCLPRDFLAIVFLYGGIAQAVTPGFWGSRGISVLIEGQASMAPSWMFNTMTPLATWSYHYPALSNAILVVALLAVAGLLYGRHPKTAGFVLMVPVLGVIWYFGQAFGGILSGMGTDPNTIPPLLILTIPAYVIWRARRTQGQTSMVGPGAAGPPR